MQWFEKFAVCKGEKIWIWGNSWNRIGDTKLLNCLHTWMPWNANNMILTFS